MNKDVPIFHHGRNQTAVVKCVDVRFMGGQCFMAHLIKEEVVEKMKQKMGQDLEVELPSIVEMKSVYDQYRKCKDCLVSIT